MIAILDYGVGNLFSLRSSWQQLGLQAVVTAERERAEKAKALIANLEASLAKLK